MKVSLQIRWLKPVHSMRGNFSEGECLFVGVDTDYIDDKNDLLQTIYDDIGPYAEGEAFEIVDEEQFWQNLSHTAETEASRIEKIRDVLRRYFEVDDDGNDSKTFDENYTAQDAIDDIHSIIGKI